MSAGPYPAVAATAVIFDVAGRVLLTRRADNGLWCLPGGHMEPEESIADTVVRETLEETGLDVVVDRAVGVYSRPHSYYAARSMRIVAFVFLCRPVGGDLRTTEETTEYGFFPADSLPADIVPPHVERIRDGVEAATGAAFVVR